MNEADWARIAIEVAIAMASGAVSTVLMAYRFGRSSAEDRTTASAEVDKKIVEVRKEISSIRKDSDDKMDKALNAADARNDLLIEQIKETLEGIRRQRDDDRTALDGHRLHVETYFYRKEAMEGFMKIYRDDQKRIDEKLDRILAMRAS